MSDDPIIQVHALGKRFGERWAVRGLDFEVDPGQIFGLLGPNGAGKTTTMRLLAGLLRPTEGGGRIAGHALEINHDDVRRNVGLLPGEPGLYESLSAEANLTFHARLWGLPGPDRERRVRTCLEQVDLWDRRAEPVGRFSKGMKQRLALARALLHAPPILLLDEPTAGLDPAVARRVRDLMAAERERGTGIVLATHDLEEARQLCDRVGFLQNRLLRVDTPANLGHQLFGRRLRLRLASDPASAITAARALPCVRDLRPTRDGFTVDLADADGDAPALVRALVQAGTEIVRLEEETHSLEEAYLEILGEAPTVVSSPPPAIPGASPCHSERSEESKK